MEINTMVERTNLQRVILPGLHSLTLQRSGCAEHFLVAAPLAGEGAAAMFGRVADALRERGARIASQEVFGLPDKEGAGTAALKAALGEIVWPVTWIENESDASPISTIVWAVTGARVEPLRMAGRVVGSLMEDKDARYCRLGGLVPTDKTRSWCDQTRDVFSQIEAGLRAAGMEFSNVARTWFYNDRILDWYGEFNKTRNCFFKQRGVYDGMIPASTGVAGPNPTGGALAAGALAIKPKAGKIRVLAVPSPLQCPANKYGSAFSRAVEIETPDHRRLLVSGTASIDPDGNTIHVGNVKKQLTLTMDVVRSILESRGMGWSNVSRAIAYFKYTRDQGTFEEYCRAKDIPPLPVALVHEDICRDDLLFEIELDALAAK